MQTTLGLLLGVILGAILALGSCAGINTGPIEDIAEGFGIDPVEVPLDEIVEGVDTDAIIEELSQVGPVDARDALDMLEAYGVLDELSEEEYEAVDAVVPDWVVVDDAQQAAEGAGFDAFLAPEGFELSLGEPFAVTYSYMDGVAQAAYDYPASRVTVRKAFADAGDPASLYAGYPLEWGEGTDGASITCYGRVDGQACKTLVVVGDYIYSIVAEGLGGDDAFGLGEEDLAKVVSALR